MRIAIIGTGGMGTRHALAFSKLVERGRCDARVVALCDVCAPRLADAKRRLEAVTGGDVAAHADYRAILDLPDLHGVVIATPEHWHATMAQNAIRARKDVYVEKPMALSLREALRLRRVAHANPDAIVVVGTQYVTTPSYSTARQLIADGAIGTPISSQTSYCRNSKDGEWTYLPTESGLQPGVNIDWEMWCGPAGEAPWDPKVFSRWRRYERYSTGILGDLLVQHLTPMVAALDAGWPTRVMARGGHHVDMTMENPDHVAIIVEFEKNHTLLALASSCNALELERVIRGHKANLVVGERETIVRPEAVYAGEVLPQVIPGPTSAETDPQDALRLHWIDCIRTRRPSVSDVDLGTKVTAIVDLAMRSIRTGSAFRFNPARKSARKA